MTTSAANNNHPESTGLVPPGQITTKDGYKLVESDDKVENPFGGSGILIEHLEKDPGRDHIDGIAVRPWLKFPSKKGVTPATTILIDRMVVHIGKHTSVWEDLILNPKSIAEVIAEHTTVLVKDSRDKRSVEFHCSINLPTGDGAVIVSEPKSIPQHGFWIVGFFVPHSGIHALPPPHPPRATGENEDRQPRHIWPAHLNRPDSQVSSVYPRAPRNA